MAGMANGLAACDQPMVALWVIVNRAAELGLKTVRIDYRYPAVLDVFFSDGTWARMAKPGDVWRYTSSRCPIPRDMPVGAEAEVCARL